MIAGLSLAAADDPDADITSALRQWGGRLQCEQADRVCTLFATDARADVRGQPERDYNAICDVLTRSLNDRTRHSSYSPDIRQSAITKNDAHYRHLSDHPGLIWIVRQF